MGGVLAKLKPFLSKWRVTFWF